MKEMEFNDNPEPELDDALPGDESGALLGQVLVDQGKLDSFDIERVVQYARDKQLRFGEAAKKLRLVSQRDIDNALAQQFDYPVLDEDAGGYSGELISAYKPFSPKAQALSNVRSKLLQHWFSKGNKTLAVVGANRKDGCSYVAANLAVMFSQLGHRTLLVDADLKAGRQHEIFNVRNKVGFSAVLVGRTTVDTVARKLDLFRDLTLLPAGAPPPNAAELLSRSELMAAFDQMRQNYDVVLFDTPPVAAYRGTDIVASACGAATVVLRKNQTLITEAELMLGQIRSSGAEVVGSILTAY